MGYEALGEVQVVRLGGTNPETGRKNSSEIEGYYVGSQSRPNKFNKEKPQKFYTFKTKAGLQGIYGKGGLDKLMAGATVGAMTKVIDTGELKDVGKGQPMKVFKVLQDRTNVDSNIGQEVEETYSASNEDESDDSDLFGEESASDEVVTAPARRATTAPAVNTAALQSKVQSLLNKSKTSR